MKSNKCKNCGSELTYNPGAGGLKCEYCGSVFEVDIDDQLNNKRSYGTSIKLNENKVLQYHCNTCNSNLNVSKDALVKRCPNCGSVDLKQTNNISLVPDGIVPFKISKEQATSNFYAWIKKRKFAPRDLKQLAKLGKLSGFYSPVWNFDCSTLTKYEGVGVEEYEDREGNKHERTYPISGEISNKYSNIMFSANKTISNLNLQRLGNWGLNNIKVYSPEYLCGFIGSDIDFDLHSTYNNFTKYVDNNEIQSIKNKYRSKYDYIENLRCRTQIYEPKFNYIYLPFWANYYTYKNKHYSCYINGFSGKVVGSAPKSFWKIFWLVFGIIAGIAVVAGIAILIGSSIGHGMANNSPFKPSDFNFDFNF